jgi:hypothetical protein
MKHLYFRFFGVAITILSLVCFGQISHAQCSGGQTGGQTAYDATIATPEGVNTLQIKFPQFNPMTDGHLRKLCVTITGIVDSVSVENNSASPQTANVFYNRTDQITGPGLLSALCNSISHHYGPYGLGATDGMIGSGPDFMSIAHDTVLNAVSVCRTLNDSTVLSQFYGSDSVAYTYDITAFTSITCTGGNYNSSISTAAFVNFHFEYCTCPPFVLPFNVRDFDVMKLTAEKAELKWSGFDDPLANYHYEAQVSRDGHSFITIGSLAKNNANDLYRLTYTASGGGSGKYFFRIKQVYSNGYSRFSGVREVTLENSDFPKFTFYPNPSNGIVGIKFDNNYSGHFNIQIFNTQGQMVAKRDIVINGSSYVKLGSLETGVYWLRLTDEKSQTSCVNQLLIK